MEGWMKDRRRMDEGWMKDRRRMDEGWKKDGRRMEEGFEGGKFALLTRRLNDYHNNTSISFIKFYCHYNF